LRAFTPSITVTVAPEIPLPVVLSLTVPLNENVVGAAVAGVDDGDVVVLLLPHADAEIRSRARQPRLNIVGFTVAPSTWST
jgi:hypothetical protein